MGEPDLAAALALSYRDQILEGQPVPATVEAWLAWRSPEGDSVLHLAIVRRDGDTAEALVRAGADINARGDMGSTPLHYARRFGMPGIADVLLTAGADSSLKDEFGEPALWNRQ